MTTGKGDTENRPDVPQGCDTAGDAEEMSPGLVVPDSGQCEPKSDCTFSSVLFISLSAIFSCREGRMLKNPSYLSSVICHLSSLNLSDSSQGQLFLALFLPRLRHRQ